MSLFSAPGSVLIKTTLVKSLRRRCSQHSDLALIKTSTDNSLWQTAMLRRSNFQEPMVLNLVLQATLPGVKKPPCVASTFLGKCASITAVDLIQRKKLGSWMFFD